MTVGDFTEGVGISQGGAAGPWVAGVSHDLTGNYSTAFWLSIACSAFSATAVWRGVRHPSNGRTKRTMPRQVLLRDGTALAFPRKFHVREDSIGCVPNLQGDNRFAALLSNPQQDRLVALYPLAFGKPWRITPASVSTIFYIEPNHGARTKLVRCGKSI